jgi:hypothetical protein
MKRSMYLSAIIAMAFAMQSCQKESSVLTESPNASVKETVLNRIDRGGGGSGGNVATIPFDFGILGMNGGTFTVNSGTTVIGDLGYGQDVISNTNQKVTTFTGKAYVHTAVSSFIYAASTYQPSQGIHQNGGGDNKLDEANQNAIAYSATYATLPANYTYGSVTNNLSITAVAHNTVVSMSSMDYNSKTLTLTGVAGNDDGFIFNVSGSFDFSQSEIKLINIRPERVIFNFPNASNITLNKASNKWNGTILAPVGNVIYHNPASFNGSIIAKNIAVHSAFNLTQHSYDTGDGNNSGGN